MMQIYRAPVRDLRFVLEEVLEASARLPRAASGPVLSGADIDAILAEAARLCEQTIAPINQSGDAIGCRLENGRVTTPVGYREAFAQYVGGGWLALTAAQAHGGQDLPNVVAFAVQEMVSSASIAFGDYVGLFAAGYRVLRDHADAQLQSRYLEAVANGRVGTAFCLTEAQAGTDLGLVRAVATPQHDGTYRIHGQKIFVSAGDHDLTPEILYFVLARLPDAPPGVRGLSLFAVPRGLDRAQLPPGARSEAVSVVRVEHKLGYAASATCQLQFDGAPGWLVGRANGGLAPMFTMVNLARLTVASQGICTAAAAYQQAARYARERLQGRDLDGAAHAELPADPIIVHADVRRVLLQTRAFVEGGRALYLSAGLLMDAAATSADPATRAAAAERLALVTPVLKATLSDLGFAACNDCLQVFGGHGYIRDTGVEQYMRDGRLAQIQEGTNAVLALDLLVRRLLRSDRRAYEALIAEMRALAESVGGDAHLAEFAAPFARGLDVLERATAWVLARADGSLTRASAGAADYARIFGLTLLAWAWVRMAAVACRAGDAGDDRFYRDKLITARFFMRRLLPQLLLHEGMLQVAAHGVFEPDVEFF